MQRKWWFGLVVALGWPLANAGENAELVAAQQQLKMIFSNITATHFAESPLPGVYEMMAGSRIVYFAPKEGVLIFGEMFNKEGRSLTAEKKSLLQADKITQLDPSAALIVGDPNAPKTIIEFTDPDCPYCRKLHQQLRTETNVKRVVFFSPLEQLHPTASKKVVHIFCSADPAKAFDEVYGDRSASAKTVWLDCEKGRQTAQAHKKVSEQFGVSGTPTVVLGDSVVSGYREAQIAQFIQD